MIEKKTAALIAGSLELGALLSTDDESVIDHFRNFGRNMGLAFQIRDDVLGIWGDRNKTGKPLGSDIQQKKKSFPIVYALEKSEGTTRAELIKIYQSKSIDNGDVDTVLKILHSVEANIQAQNMAKEFCDKAMAEIDKMKLLPWANDSLKEMAYFLVDREF